ncbi:NAD(P)-dependent oxidoreductase [Prochlorococcus marinus str. MU1404]|uniref:NAD-dependent epimerase/dehydratase family protein n=1 Tax=Prochlorococcus marinus TaxID=1219 RepID=UPI001ADA6570|nr:NAD-dependent epimerase/dehydratase family protein [Prochlorococcus marinus]MBO8229194.1 NAD-dependent epimerase/dehydratase family protein [Prochlorococcus marinus XMU1404]MBW3072277.1 NAD(P)-dependent oxidoreductase [Prochlorococcus marinus str. MU1404]MCR8544623.1 NAD-dependent epimerase/dehydratase family protein [Prochlorococcus marinus CUG1432]
MNNIASSLSDKNKFLILGCGFSGTFFAKAIRQLGCTALTSSRSRDKNPNSFVFNSENNIIPDEKIFDGVTHILSCIPPDKNGNDPVLGSLKKKLKSLSLEWVGYLSTTGVYGNTKGDWVSETDQPNPFQYRSHKRLSCEKEWIESGLPVQIFRLPGIYGPGRSTFEAIRNKKIRVISKKNQVFSRIHVADIANAIIYLLDNKNTLKFHQIINIADDEPCSQIEVIQYCYDLLSLKMPQPISFEDAKEELSPIAQSFWMENRRVSNKLLCETLGYKLIYKNYKLGLKNCFLNI